MRAPDSPPRPPAPAGLPRHPGPARPCRHPAATDGILIKTSGLPARDGAHHGDEVPAVRERILRPAWVSDALLAETVAVWSEAYGRPVGEAEAMGILMSVKRLGEALLRAKMEGRK